MAKRKSVTAEELIKFLQEIPEKIDLVDIRKGYEFKALHLVNSHRVSDNQLAEYLSCADLGKIIILVSRDGERSERIIQSLSHLPFSIFNLENGLDGILKHPLGILAVKKPAYV